MNETSKHLTLTIKDLPSLYAAYMPFLKNGGLFIPTASYFHPGQMIFVSVQLPGEAEPRRFHGRVAWRTPVGAQGRRTPGVGIHFEQVEEGVISPRQQIEKLLGELLQSDKPTQTI
ncbi:PilZ domain-containing protein [Marinospirillum sp. MEB164]|uniref:PilZ domain-containing protein n=1 Tax=Marinospirillum alkalitolerans TaxID=3123374 RepID=A0ABW8Q0Z2_9GAMM